MEAVRKKPESKETDTINRPKCMQEEENYDIN